MNKQEKALWLAEANLKVKKYHLESYLFYMIEKKRIAWGFLVIAMSIISLTLGFILGRN